MQALDVVRLAALIAAFAASASKLLPATLPFWERIWPPLSRWIPGLVLMAGALPAALAGVSSWEQFALAVMGAAAFALPGTHKNLAAPVAAPASQERVSLRPPPKPPSIPPLAMLCFLVLGLLSCASSPPPKPCSANDPAVTAKLAECKLRMLSECKGVEPEACPVRNECRQWVRDFCGAAQ